jgi:hypothetical protein
MGRANPGQRHQGGLNPTVLPLSGKLNATDIGATRRQDEGRLFRALAAPAFGAPP